MWWLWALNGRDKEYRISRAWWVMWDFEWIWRIIHCKNWTKHFYGKGKLYAGLSNRLAVRIMLIEIKSFVEMKIWTKCKEEILNILICVSCGVSNHANFNSSSTKCVYKFCKFWVSSHRFRFYGLEDYSPPQNCF